MADQRDQGITWTDETWNPVRGCSRVSQGCVNCYAERVASRFGGPNQPYEGLVRVRPLSRDDKYSPPIKPQWTGEVRMVPEHLADPLKWKRPRRVFVNSMSDLFHEKLGNEEIGAVFGVMAAAPRHTFQILTKRPERMREWFRWAEAHQHGGGYEGALGAIEYAISCCPHPLPASTFGGEGDEGAALSRSIGEDWPLPNVWLGVSVEDQKTADERIPLLLETPAAVRFISAEPLLGPLDLNRIDATKAGWRAVNGFPEPTAISAFGKWQERPTRARLQNGLDWVIVGGESGPGARPMHPDWARSLRDQCVAAGVAFHFKQWGEWAFEIDVERDDPDGRLPYAEYERQGCRVVNLAGGLGFHGERVHIARRAGKRFTGRVLDGRTWDEFPVTGVRAIVDDAMGESR